MNFIALLSPFRTDRSILAGVRDQIIEIGTQVRFLVADQQKPQPRDIAGRFVSARPDRRAELERLIGNLDTDARRAAISRASIRPSLQSERGRK